MRYHPGIYGIDRSRIGVHRKGVVGCRKIVENLLDDADHDRDNLGKDDKEYAQDEDYDKDGLEPVRH